MIRVLVLLTGEPIAERMAFPEFYHLISREFPVPMAFPLPFLYQREQ